MDAPDICLQYVAGDTPVTIRTMTPADRAIEAEFVRNLSNESRYFRFHSALRELTPAMLERFTHVSYPENMALIATIGSVAGETQIGVARYAKTTPGGDEAEVAVVVADDWQRRGIGTRLLKELRDVAVRGGIHKLHANVLAQNHRMLNLARELGFAYEKGSSSYTARQLGKSVVP